MGTPRGTGSIRERRPGVWEIRVAAGVDAVTSRTLQRSVTFHGSAADAETYRSQLAAEYAARRAVTRAAPMLTVAELLERWLVADHRWKPSRWVGYRSNARHLIADAALARTKVVSITPRLLRAAFERWEADGATPSVVSGRFRALRSAVGSRSATCAAPGGWNRADRGPTTTSAPCCGRPRRTCWLRWRTTTVGIGRKNGGVSQSRISCSFVLPRTPAPGVANSPPSDSPTSTGACFGSSGRCRPSC